jgi:DNA-binding MarR family transcriptional regulator
VDDVELDFSVAVRAVSMAYAHYRTVAVRATFGVGATEGSALGELYLNGELTPTDLARRLRLTTPTTTEVLDRLERAGHVARKRHPHDRRKVLVSLDSETSATIERHAPAFVELLGPALDGLDPAVRRSVVEVLQRSATMLEDAARAGRAAT